VVVVLGDALVVVVVVVVVAVVAFLKDEEVRVIVRVTEQRTAVAGQGLSEVQGWPIAQHLGSLEELT
jgi:hypothetical protein